VVTASTHNIGPSTTDKRGSFTVDTLLQGEYTIGMYDYTVGDHEMNSTTHHLLSVSPNPSQSSFNIRLSGNNMDLYQVLIYDMGGRIIQTILDLPGGSAVDWNGERFDSGVYRVVQQSGTKKVAVATLMLNK
jgi:hypothetical protein